MADLPDRGDPGSAGRMLRMDQVHVVRHKVLIEGRSQRSVARELGLSRMTIGKYVDQAMPVMRLMYSGRDFAWIYERQDQISFLDGHVRRSAAVDDHHL